jgi:hypothetical protein
MRVIRPLPIDFFSEVVFHCCSWERHLAAIIVVAGSHSHKKCTFVMLDGLEEIR